MIRTYHMRLHPIGCFAEMQPPLSSGRHPLYRSELLPGILRHAGTRTCPRDRAFPVSTL